MFFPESPYQIIKSIAERVKKNRLELNLTQKAMAKRAGMSFGSYCRFENTGEISFKSLIMIAISLGATEEFGQLFTQRQYQSVEQILKLQQTKTKKRGRKNE